MKKELGIKKEKEQNSCRNDALLPFRQNFTGGMRWQKLVKHFAAQAKKGDDYNVTGIEDWDFNLQYVTSRFLTANVEIKNRR